MTVLIKGMEMPENCIYCPVVDDEYGGCLIDDKSHGDPNKPIDCPLIEVPTPHGRLIDADAFKAMLIDALDDARDEFIRHDDFLKAKKVTESLLMDIDEAPTVIEAEEIKE